MGPAAKFWMTMHSGQTTSEPKGHGRLRIADGPKDDRMRQTLSISIQHGTAAERLDARTLAAALLWSLRWGFEGAGLGQAGTDQNPKSFANAKLRSRLVNCPQTITRLVRDGHSRPVGLLLRLQV